MNDPIQFVEPSEVDALVKRGDWVVVDVRDEDRSVGWVPGSVHLPSESLTAAAMESFIACYAQPPRVMPNGFVFHCMYSKQRGPRAAQLCLAALASMQQRKAIPHTMQPPSVYVMKGGFQNYAKAFPKKCQV